jgi:hypothetical protein
MTETKRAGLTPVSNSTAQVYIEVILYEDVGIILYGIFKSSYTEPFYLVIATSDVSTYSLVHAGVEDTSLHTLYNDI